ncbi:MAG: tRNA (adenosine(37)-N6)-dimethylallyltransferase MiaA [Candidatus Berkelbacteria bacterium]|nr:tRNA (adenosine(37)-N6)-dimethylallyltransferase MiaA [Candidatus Berkelbacteria bacterium]
MNKKITCIVGPTASGKTAVGIKLAEKFNGEIISADSRQVFKKLDIGTGKDLGEYEKIKYHLIDICNPGKKFTVFDWLKNTKVAIDNIFSRGKSPIVVGGTGLYVEALCEGYDLNKKSKAKSKNYKRKELEKKTAKELIKICEKLRVNTEKLDINNPRRLIRAIEKAGEGISATKTKPDFQTLQIGINLPREKLYEKIDRRVNERFKLGMLEEVRDLLNCGVDPKWLLNLGLEYKIIGNHILNPDKQTFEQMSQELKYKIHAYARRQLTWFRHHGNVKWVPSYKEAEKIAKHFLNAT